MAVVSIEKLKSYFKRFSKPTESNFSDLIDSFIHKDDATIPTNIESIVELGDFASKDAACAWAARAEVAGNKKAALLLFTATGATGSKLEGRIFQQVNGTNESMQILMWDKKIYRRNVTGATGNEGDNTNAFTWEETGAQKLEILRTTSAIQLQLKSYENGVISSKTIPLADNTYSGLMSASKSKKLAEYASTFSANPVATEQNDGLMGHGDRSVLMNTGVIHLNGVADGLINTYVQTGTYRVTGERTNANDGLPIMNANPGHTVEGILKVLTSKIDDGGKDNDAVVTQILTMTNRYGGDGHTWLRTGKGPNTGNLTWGTWQVMQGIFEKGAITDANELNTYTDNGMYSCLYASKNTTIINNFSIRPGDQILVITQNNSAAASLGLTPNCTQVLYFASPSSGTEICIRYAILASTGKYVWTPYERVMTNSGVDRIKTVVSADHITLRSHSWPNSLNISFGESATIGKNVKIPDGLVFAYADGVLTITAPDGKSTTLTLS